MSFSGKAKQLGLRLPVIFVSGVDRFEINSEISSILVLMQLALEPIHQILNSLLKVTCTTVHSSGAGLEIRGESENRFSQ